MQKIENTDTQRDACARFELARPLPGVPQGNAEMQDQLMMHTPDDWLRLFAQEQVQFIVLNQRGDGELVKAIHLQPEWIVDFEDDEAVIFALRRNTA